MTILGCDPGTTKSAYCIIEDGEIRCFGIEDNATLLTWFREGLFKPRPDYIFCEMIAGMGMAVGKEVFETILWIGQFKEASRRTPFELVYRKDIKMNLCCTMRSKDKDVRAALLKIWGEPGTKQQKGQTYGVSSHVWSALAVATFALRTRL